MNVDDPLLTISVAYYNEPKHLKKWVDQQSIWKKMDMPIHLQIIDDGSQITPASEIIKESMPNISLYRVKEDLGFNSHGCRNLGMKVAPTSWVLLSDIDLSYPISTLNKMLLDIEDCKLSQDYYYQPVHFNNIIIININNFLIHKDTFWKTGGYDEEFTGLHYGDRTFLANLGQFAVESDNGYFAYRLRLGRLWRTVPGLMKTEYPNDELILHPESILDSPSLLKRLHHRIRIRNKSAEGRTSKKVIQFEWERLI
jgi:hypothetical protein